MGQLGSDGKTFIVSIEVGNHQLEAGGLPGPGINRLLPIRLINGAGESPVCLVELRQEVIDHLVGERRIAAKDGRWKGPGTAGHGKDRDVEMFQPFRVRYGREGGTGGWCVLDEIACLQVVAAGGTM